MAESALNHVFQASVYDLVKYMYSKKSSLPKIAGSIDAAWNQRQGRDSLHFHLLNYRDELSARKLRVVAGHWRRVLEWESALSSYEDEGKDENRKERRRNNNTCRKSHRYYRISIGLLPKLQDRQRRWKRMDFAIASRMRPTRTKTFQKNLAWTWVTTITSNQILKVSFDLLNSQFIC